MAKNGGAFAVVRAAIEGARSGVASWRVAGMPPADYVASRVRAAEAYTVERDVTADEAGFRRAAGGKNDLSPWDQTRMQRVALFLYRHNHMARRILGFIEQFTVGDGIIVAAKHEVDAVAKAVDSVITEFWQDTVNAMDRKNEQRVREFNLWGEICMPIMRNIYDGRVRLGWICPLSIVAVRCDPASGDPAVVVVSDEAAKQIGTKELRIVRWNDELGAYEGECFFASMNTVGGASRGVSELFSASDWIDTLDETLKAQADRVKLMSHFIWDVTLEDADQKECDAWLAANGAAPKPNAVRAHNQKITYAAVAPDLKSYESANHIKLLKSHILGGCAIPNHWYGSGDDANLATAEQMAEPTRKALRAKQQQFRWLLTDVIRYVLWSRSTVGQAIPGWKPGDPDPFEVQIPDLSGPDVAKVGAALVQVTNAITVAEDRGYITQETARTVWAAVASQTGITIDPAAEAEGVAGDEAARAKEDAARELAEEDGRRQALAAVRAGPGGAVVPFEGRRAAGGGGGAVGA